jgi:hypothetical protein
MLTEQLSAALKAAAAIQNVGPWTICGGDSIDAMARRLPTTVPQLQTIPGFGMVKANIFGLTFLPVIQQFIVRENIPVPPNRIPQAIYYTNLGMQPPPQAAAAVGAVPSPQPQPLLYAQQYAPQQFSAAPRPAPFKPATAREPAAASSSAVPTRYNLPLQSVSRTMAGGDAQQQQVSPHFQRYPSYAGAAVGDKRRRDTHQQQVDRLFDFEADRNEGEQAQQEEEENSRPAMRPRRSI